MTLLLNKPLKIAITGAMATCLAFTMGTGTYADEDIPTEQIEQEAEVTVSAETEVSELDDLTQVEEKGETPSLVPGDFFYFVKIMTEKVRLALTMDDYKEAKLLAGFAAERIAEANALFAAGNGEEATTLLQEAIKTQEQAEVKLAEKDSTDAVDTESTELEENDVVQTSDDVVADSDAKVIEADIEIETEKETDEVKVKLANNIAALTAALSHVDNPTAQQNLMKNIQKSFAKLEKKIEKRSEKLAEKEVEAEGNEASDLEVDVAVEASSNEAEEVDESSVEKVNVLGAKAEIKKAEKKQEVAKKVEEKKEAAVNKGQEKQQAAAEKVQEKKQEVQKKQADKKKSDKE